MNNAFIHRDDIFKVKHFTKVLNHGKFKLESGGIPSKK